MKMRRDSGGPRIGHTDAPPQHRHIERKPQPEVGMKFKEEPKEKRLVCPIRMFKTNDTNNSQCLKEECAFFTLQYRACAITRLAEKDLGGRL